MGCGPLWQLKEGCYGLWSIAAVKAQQQEQVAADHIASSVRKQRWMNAHTQLDIFLLCRPDARA